MGKKHSQTINFDSELYRGIVEFCKLNQIDNVDNFIVDSLKSGFYIAKYGMMNESEPAVIETIKEVPVETIKYIEKEIVKEVPVETIKYVDREVIKEVVKEVPVETIKYIDREVIKEVKIENNQPVIDNGKQQMLQDTISKLRNELMDKTKEIEGLNNKVLELTEVLNFKATYYKTSNLNEHL